MQEVDAFLNAFLETDLNDGAHLVTGELAGNGDNGSGSGSAKLVESRSCSCKKRGDVGAMDTHQACDQCGAVTAAKDAPMPGEGLRKYAPSHVLDRCGPITSELYPESEFGWCLSGGATRGMHHRDRMTGEASTLIRARGHAGSVGEAILLVAERVFKTVSDAPSVSRTRRQGLAEGAMYAACRICGAPRSMAEIAQMFDVDAGLVKKGAQRVVDVLVSGAGPSESKGNPLLIPSPSDFIPRFVFNTSPRTNHDGTYARLALAYAKELSEFKDVEDVAPDVVAAVATSLAWEHTGRAGGANVAARASGVACSSIHRVTKSIGSLRFRMASRVSARVLGPGSAATGHIYSWAKTPPTAPSDTQ